MALRSHKRTNIFKNKNINKKKYFKILRYCSLALRRYYNCDWYLQERCTGSILQFL